MTASYSAPPVPPMRSPSYHAATASKYGATRRST